MKRLCPNCQMIRDLKRKYWDTDAEGLFKSTGYVCQVCSYLLTIIKPTPFARMLKAERAARGLPAKDYESLF